jgi:hypothetical protein
MIVRTAILLASVTLLCAGRLDAQQTPWRGGVWASGALVSPAATFRQIPGTEICLEEGATLDPDGGRAFAFGGEGGWKEQGSPIELSMRVGIAFASTAFARQETVGRIAMNDGSLAPFIVEYRAEIDRVELRLEPIVRWSPIGPFSLSGGILAALPLAISYDQRELIAAPASAVYETGSAVRNESTGSLASAQPWTGATLSLAADLAAGRVLLRPEIGIVVALGSPSPDVDVRPHELRAGIGVIFGALGESTPITPYEPVGDER